MSRRIEIVPLGPLPEVRRGDRLGAMLVDAARDAGIELRDDDVVVVSQKVISKAEGRVRSLADVRPGDRARELARGLGRDPRMVELVLDQSRRIVRAERGVLIVETHLGWVCANAGIDVSNVPGEEMVSLLPEDPDASARRLRDEVAQVGGTRPALVVADSFGRPWRLGQAEVAIGCAGLAPLDDWRGSEDREGRPLTSTEIAIADELAAAADLARDKAAGIPAVLVRGAGEWVRTEHGPGAAALRRDEAEDLFR